LYFEGVFFFPKIAIGHILKKCPENNFCINKYNFSLIVFQAIKSSSESMSVQRQPPEEDLSHRAEFVVNL